MLPTANPSGQHTPASTRPWALGLGSLAVLMQLTLVWGFEFFPTVDGPAHVHLAHAMFEALRGDGFYGSLVEFNHRLNPNFATQGMLLALMAIASPFVAEKIWLSLYFAAFAAAGAYALQGFNRNSLCLLPLLVFCSVSFPLAFGFYNFSFSTVVLLAWSGYWWRHREMPSWRVVAMHALFAVIAYATHVFAFIVSLLAIGVIGTVEILLHACRDPGKGATRLQRLLQSFRGHALPPLLGSLPVLIAGLIFLFGRFGAGTASGAANLGTPDSLRFHDLLTATSLAPYDGSETLAAGLFVAAAVVLLLLFALMRWLRGGRVPDHWVSFAVCFGVFLALYQLMPSQWIVRWMPARFQPLVLVVLLFWLAAAIPTSITRLHWRVIGMAGLLLLAGSVASRYLVFARLDGYFREYASAASHIAPNSTLIALRLHDTWQGRPFPANLDVLIQAGSRLATMRHSVDLKNFQGQSSDHPIQFRPGVSATAALGGDHALVSLPPRIRLMEYERQTGRPIDYVLFYGFRESVPIQDALGSIDAQLQDNYRLIHVSKPLGLVHLYARNRPMPGDGAAP